MNNYLAQLEEKCFRLIEETKWKHAFELSVEIIRIKKSSEDDELLSQFTSKFLNSAADLGISLIANSKFNSAVQLLTSLDGIFSEDPEIPKIYNKFSLVFQGAGKSKMAKKCLIKGLKNPGKQKASLLVNLSTVLNSLKQPGEALRCASKAIELFQEELLHEKHIEDSEYQGKMGQLIVAYHNSAVIEESLGNTENALKLYKKAQDYMDKHGIEMGSLNIAISNNYQRAKNLRKMSQNSLLRGRDSSVNRLKTTFSNSQVRHRRVYSGNASLDKFSSIYRAKPPIKPVLSKSRIQTVDSSKMRSYKYTHQKETDAMADVSKIEILPYSYQSNEKNPKAKESTKGIDMVQKPLMFESLFKSKDDIQLEIPDNSKLSGSSRDADSIEFPNSQSSRNSKSEDTQLSKDEIWKLSVNEIPQLYVKTSQETGIAKVENSKSSGFDKFDFSSLIVPQNYNQIATKSHNAEKANDLSSASRRSNKQQDIKSSGNSQGGNSDVIQSKHSDAIQNKHSDAIQNKHSDAIQSKHSDAIQSKNSENIQSKNSDTIQSKNSDTIQSKNSENIQRKSPELIKRKSPENMKRPENRPKNNYQNTKKPIPENRQKKFSDKAQMKTSEIIHKKKRDAVQKNKHESMHKKESDKVQVSSSGSTPNITYSFLDQHKPKSKEDATGSEKMDNDLDKSILRSNILQCIADNLTLIQLRYMTISSQKCKVEFYTNTVHSLLKVVAQRLKDDHRMECSIKDLKILDLDGVVQYIKQSVLDYLHIESDQLMLLCYSSEIGAQMIAKGTVTEESSVFFISIYYFEAKSSVFVEANDLNVYLREMVTIENLTKCLKVPRNFLFEDPSLLLLTVRIVNSKIHLIPHPLLENRHDYYCNRFISDYLCDIRIYKDSNKKESSYFITVNSVDKNSPIEPLQLSETFVKSFVNIRSKNTYIFLVKCLEILQEKLKFNSKKYLHTSSEQINLPALIKAAVVIQKFVRSSKSKMEAELVRQKIERESKRRCILKRIKKIGEHYFYISLYDCYDCFMLECSPQGTNLVYSKMIEDQDLDFLENFDIFSLIDTIEEGEEGLYLYNSGLKTRSYFEINREQNDILSKIDLRTRKIIRGEDFDVKIKKGVDQKIEIEICNEWKSYTTNLLALDIIRIVGKYSIKEIVNSVTINDGEIIFPVVKKDVMASKLQTMKTIHPRMLLVTSKIQLPVIYVITVNILQQEKTIFDDEDLLIFEVRQGASQVETPKFEIFIGKACEITGFRTDKLMPMIRYIVQNMLKIDKQSIMIDYSVPPVDFDAIVTKIQAAYRGYRFRKWQKVNCGTLIGNSLVQIDKRAFKTMIFDKDDTYTISLQGTDKSYVFDLNKNEIDHKDSSNVNSVLINYLSGLCIEEVNDLHEK